MTQGRVDWLELERQTRRLTERYIDEVVLRFGLCPWAAAAIEEGRTEILVITEYFSSSQLAIAARACATALLRVPADKDLVLVVLPCLRASRLDMDALLRIARAELEADSRPGADSRVAEFALAAFHPDAFPDATNPERFIPFLRRSPDPLIQAVRSEALTPLEAGRSVGTSFVDPTLLGAQAPTVARESLRARVARHNLQTVTGHGIDRFRQVLEDILADRDRIHRTLGVR